MIRYYTHTHRDNEHERSEFLPIGAQMTTPTQRLLDDIACAGGPTVTLEARLNDQGGVVRLSVLVYDATRVQVLRMPCPRDERLHSFDEARQFLAFMSLLIEDGLI